VVDQVLASLDPVAAAVDAAPMSAADAVAFKLRAYQGAMLAALGADRGVDSTSPPADAYALAPEATCDYCHGPLANGELVVHEHCPTAVVAS
jgi:hypothetical protein